ncbi:diacylglycerol/polyprenol kinase family protein [Prochlorococcus marinus]|uniref:Dolichol kinase n=1 Tax=Prochlorococcus marinus (strain MIT 9211) TaxID=93059 RepID=A9BDQ1_PROM4|nr:dolichol kinase [Prochlorococcus marinus]ABX09763.1 Dolichol kinase [Prochlorococcus marinus str. MIT 9211]
MSILIPLLIIGGWLSLVLLSSLLSKKVNSKNNELGRKIIHIGTGPVVLLAWWLKIPANVAILFASLITISLVINYQTNWISTLENVKRKSYGTVAYGLSITILLILFWSKNPAAVCAGVMVMAFGDGLAGLIGQQFKSPVWRVLDQQKSLIGTLTMGCIGLIVLFSISMMQEIHLEPIQILAISLIAVGLEQISPYGIDNLTVPISVAVGWDVMTHALQAMPS